MKTLVVPDLHNKEEYVLPYVEKLIKAAKVDKVIFTGDYVDEFGSRPEDNINSLSYLVAWKNRMQSEGIELVFLYGNHDLAYVYDGIGCSGHHRGINDKLRPLFEELQPKIVYQEGDYLISHAGFTDTWVKRYITDVDNIVEQTNSLLDTDYMALYEVGRARGGYYNDCPGPLWADKSELLSSYLPGVNQIVSHSPVSQVHIYQTETDETLVFCDTMSLRVTMQPIGNGNLVLITDGTDVESIPLSKSIGYDKIIENREDDFQEELKKRQL